MIRLNGKTKPTTNLEKLLWQAGGKTPDATLGERELAETLVKAIDVISRVKPELLVKFYEAGRRKGLLPPLDAGDSNTS